MTLVAEWSQRDLEDAGYGGGTLRLAHNATREVVEVLGLRPFYWEVDGFRLFYLGQCARMSRNQTEADGRRGHHSPIDRPKWAQLCAHAAREPDAPALLRLLWLCFPLYLRVGEAASVHNTDIKFDRGGQPCGVLLRASTAAAGAWSTFDERPKGSLQPGGKEWAAPADDLACQALAKVVRLPMKCAP